jgi:hypothetical protein
MSSVPICTRLWILFYYNLKTISRTNLTSLFMNWVSQEQMKFENSGRNRLETRNDFAYQILRERTLMFKFLILPKLIGLIHPFKSQTWRYTTSINRNGLCIWSKPTETIDELLKPFKRHFAECRIGFYNGKSWNSWRWKGDIMIPNAHINEEQLIIIFSIMN